MSKGDFQEIYPLPDLTITIPELVKSTHYRLLNLNSWATHQLLLGGMANSSQEQMAILIVAEALKSANFYPGTFFKITSNIQGNSSTQDVLQSSAAASQALALNGKQMSGSVI